MECLDTAIGARNNNGPAFKLNVIGKTILIAVHQIIAVWACADELSGVWINFDFFRRRRNGIARKVVSVHDDQLVLSINLRTGSKHNGLLSVVYKTGGYHRQ